MRKIKRRKKVEVIKTEEKEFLLQQFTTLLFLVRQYFRDQQLPDGWGLGASKKKSEKELLHFLKKHGGIDTVNLKKLKY